MADTRKKDFNWGIKTNDDGTTPTPDAHLATLMDIRDELKRLNSLLCCPNFVAIPRKLDAIKRNTDRKCPTRRSPRPPT